MVPSALIYIINALKGGLFLSHEPSLLFFILIGDDILVLWAKVSTRVSDSKAWLDIVGLGLQSGFLPLDHLNIVGLGLPTCFFKEVQAWYQIS